MVELKLFNEKIFCLFLAIGFVVLNGCATESSRSLDTQTVRAASTATLYQGAKLPISVGKFNNRSNYHNGVFSDDMDQLGNQSKIILVHICSKPGAFCLDRVNLSVVLYRG